MPLCTADGKPLRVGFVVAGMMAGAMIRGLVTSATCTADNMIASDAYRPCLDTLAADLKMKVTDENTEVATSADVVFIATKPQQVQDVCASIGKSGANPIVVSIAAGVTLDSLAGWLPSGCRIVRVMPNTPAMVGELAAGYAPNAACSDADAALVGSILGALGTAFKVKESDLDAVTGLSGSGPAYVFQFIEALSDGGVRAGLTRPVATQLAAKTVRGAATMVLQTGKHPGELKDQVTSPGGTTIAGVHALEMGGMRAAVMNAVVAATERSRELGKPK